MFSMTDLYDRPGSYLVDHPQQRKVAKRMSALVCAVALFMLVGGPGGVGQYAGHQGGGSVLRV